MHVFVPADPREINEDRLCYEESLKREEWPWIGKSTQVVQMSLKKILCRRLRGVPRELTRQEMPQNETRITLSCSKVTVYCPQQSWHSLDQLSPWIT